MIYDGHAYCFTDQRGDGGYADAAQFRRHIQLAIAHHLQPVWRSRDRAPADSRGLIDLSKPWGFESLKEADFRPTRYGRFEWTVDGEDYVKQYMPPSVVNMEYTAEMLVAEMDYAGVDWAMLHRTPTFDIGNDFVADCVRRFPGRLQGLAHVEEWLVQSEPDASIRKLERAVNELGLSGLQFLPDHLTMYGQKPEWDAPGFRPFWDGVAAMNIPLFMTPSFMSLGSGVGSTTEAYLEELRVLRSFMERYPDMKLVLTHGFGWRTFQQGDTLSVPDEVFDAAPVDNPNFSLQLLFAIFFGGDWDYPMPQVRPTLEKLVERIGVDRLMWGTDVPMVMRFYTYRQSLEFLRLNLDFLSQAEVDLVLGGNMARFMGIEGT